MHLQMAQYVRGLDIRCISSALSCALAVTDGIMARHQWTHLVLCYVHSMYVLVVKVMRLSAGRPSVDSCPDTQVTTGASPGHNCTSDAEKPHLTDSHIQAHRCIIWCMTLKCVLVIPISI